MNNMEKIWIIAAGVVLGNVLTLILSCLVAIPIGYEMAKAQETAIKESVKKLNEIGEAAKKEVLNYRPQIRKQQTRHMTNDQIKIARFKQAAKICDRWRIEYANNPTALNKRYKMRTCKVMQNILH